MSDLDPLPRVRSRNQFPEPARARFLFLAGDHPPDRVLPITRRLTLKKLPRIRARAKLFLIRLAQDRRFPVLVRIDSRFLFPPRGESLQPRGTHSAQLRQLPHSPEVHGAPGAGRFARRETDLVALLIDRLTQTIDPPEAERFVHRFRPGDAGPAGIFFVEADSLLAAASVMNPEPVAEVRRGSEEKRPGRFHL